MLSVAVAVALCAGLASAGCPTNVPWKEFGGFCYWRSTYTTSWNQAVIACRTYGSGSQLASIHSLLENAFIMQTYNYAESWIGLNDIAKEGSFQWADGTRVSYTNWDRDQPDDYKQGQDCVRLPHHLNPRAASWDDNRCDSSRHFLCKMPAST